MILTLSDINKFKPRDKGTPRGSRNDRIYSSNLVPAEHLKLLNGIKTALAGENSGEIIFQRVLDIVNMSRSSALKIIRYLEKYGYLKYEPKPRQHRVFVKIFNKKEHDNNEIRN